MPRHAYDHDDMVKYLKLFKLSFSKGIYPPVARLLVFMYTNQSLIVNWNSTSSECFSWNNGIKQGGIFSPVIFYVHMDELLNFVWRLQMFYYISLASVIEMSFVTYSIPIELVIHVMGSLCGGKIPRH